MKRYEVVLTEDAEHDLEDIYHYIAKFDLPEKAGHVLGKLLEVTDRLATFPEQGLQPKELRSLGIEEYRQIFFKPYRVMYRVVGKKVVIYLITDGRRDMQALLMRRLFGG